MLYVRSTLHCSISKKFLGLFQPLTQVIFQICWLLSMHICVCELKVIFRAFNNSLFLTPLTHSSQTFVIFWKSGKTLAVRFCNFYVLRLGLIFTWINTHLRERYKHCVPGTRFISNILKSFAKTSYFQNLVVLP